MSQFLEKGLQRKIWPIAIKFYQTHKELTLDCSINPNTHYQNTARRQTHSTNLVLSWQQKQQRHQEKKKPIGYKNIDRKSLLQSLATQSYGTWKVLRNTAKWEWQEECKFSSTCGYQWIQNTSIENGENRKLMIILIDAKFD